MRRLTLPLLVFVLIAFAGTGVNQAKQTGDKLQLKEVQLKDASAELKELKLKYDSLNIQLDNTEKTNTEQIKRLEEEKNRLEQERIRLEGELQAKLYKRQQEKERQDRLAREAVNRATGTARAYANLGGTCDDWIAAAGITEVASAKELIRRESGCNPYAVNRSSGACGVAQELPCGKSGCSLGDGACQVRWMNGYVINRYGSWAAAVSFHDRNNWYWYIAYCVIGYIPRTFTIRP